MRTSCNGCRVLRKGCTDDCSIRTCLQWIKSPESQANATVFLAKFYGRAGLMNLINAGPEHLRPDIFKSLLYESCGRIVDPMYGSVGLLWSGNWHHCQAAVDAVLGGSQIMPISSDMQHPTPLLNGHDIRHVPKDSNSAASSHDLHKVKTRTRFKRSSAKPNPQVESGTEFFIESTRFGNPGRGLFSSNEFNRAPSLEDESMFSVETVEASLVNRAKPDRVLKSECQTDDGEVGLELTLGFPHVCTREGRSEMDGSDGEKCEMELGF